MDRIDDPVPTDHGLRNVRFLLEQQVQLVSMLSETGRDASAAQALLRKLIDLESAMRMRVLFPQASVEDAFAAA